MNSPRKKTIGISDGKERLLRAAVRSAMHELNQSLTALSFTASNLRLLAEKATERREADLSKELREMSLNMSEAENRYRKTTALLDWLTAEADTLKKIDIDALLGDILKLSETTLRKQHIQIACVRPSEVIQIYSFYGALTYLIFSLFWTIAEISKKYNLKKSTAWKVTLETTFQATHIGLRLNTPFEKISMMDITKQLASELSATLKIEKRKPNGASDILLLLPHHPDKAAAKR
jgi:hypothetical protein